MMRHLFDHLLWFVFGLSILAFFVTLAACVAEVLR